MSSLPPDREQDIRAVTSPSSNSFQIANYPFYRIARVTALYSECLDLELKPRGMDQSRWRVLMILSAHDSASMGVVAELAVMKLPTLLKLVRRMTDEGLLRNAPRLSDQRVIEISITPRGRKALMVIRRAAAKIYAGAISNLSANDVATINDTFSRLELNLADMRTTEKRRQRRPKTRSVDSGERPTDVTG